MSQSKRVEACSQQSCQRNLRRRHKHKDIHTSDESGASNAGEDGFVLASMPASPPFTLGIL